jgi:hypothetical protein
VSPLDSDANYSEIDDLEEEESGAPPGSDSDDPDNWSDNDYFGKVAPMTLSLDDDDSVMLDEDRSTIPKTPPPPPELALESLTLDEQGVIEAYMYITSLYPTIMLIYSRWNGLADSTEMEHKYLRKSSIFASLSIPLRSNISLFEWQRLGVVFLDFARRKYGFAILADEMGVGKVRVWPVHCDTDE